MTFKMQDKTMPKENKREGGQISSSTHDDLNLILFPLFCMCLLVYLRAYHVMGYLRGLRKLHKAHLRDNLVKESQAKDT
jgi:hypothetical protein